MAVEGTGRIGNQFPGDALEDVRGAQDADELAGLYRPGGDLARASVRHAEADLATGGQARFGCGPGRDRTGRGAGSLHRGEDRCGDVEGIEDLGGPLARPGVVAGLQRMAPVGGHLMPGQHAPQQVRGVQDELTRQRRAGAPDQLSQRGCRPDRQAQRPPALCAQVLRLGVDVGGPPVVIHQGGPHRLSFRGRQDQGSRGGADGDSDHFPTAAGQRGGSLPEGGGRCRPPAAGVLFAAAARTAYRLGQRCPPLREDPPAGVGAQHTHRGCGDIDTGHHGDSGAVGSGAHERLDPLGYTDKYGR